jgi:hypothetical protein
VAGAGSPLGGSICFAVSPVAGFGAESYGNLLVALDRWTGDGVDVIPTGDPALLLPGIYAKVRVVGDPEAIPEPGTLLLLGAGAAVLGVQRWRRVS